MSKIVFFQKSRCGLARFLVLFKNWAFHLTENALVQVRRPDKPGAPTERHLVTGFSRQLTGTAEMTINCTSVQDFPEATLTSLPGDEN